MCSVLVFSLFVLFCSAVQVPYFRAKGSHREVGIAVGKNFENQMRTFINLSEDLKILLPFYATPQGKQIVEQFVSLNSQRYPHYFDELEGMSLGSGLPFYYFILLAFADEIQAGWIPEYYHNKTRLKGCSDIHVHSELNTIMGHNEDADPSIRTLAYMLELEITETGQHFISYTYPGFLSGMAWGWSKVSQLVFSFNWVGPLDVNIGIGRNFIGRDILAATSVEDALHRATPPNRAYGFTLNLGDYGLLKTFNIEVAPQVYSFWEVKQNFSHFNEYKVLSIPQSPDTSTNNRQTRCDQFSIPKTMDDVRAILGDTKDSTWPIYRNATAPDTDATVVTAIFDLVEESAYVWTSNPKDDNAEYLYILYGH